MIGGDWLYTYIIVPIAAPFVSVGVIRLFPKAPKVGFLSQVKDGQLFWVVIAICVAAFNDIIEARGLCVQTGQGPGAPNWDAYELSLLTVVFVCFSLATLSSAYAGVTTDPEVETTWWDSNSVFVVSLFFAIGGAMLCYLIYKDTHVACNHYLGGLKHA